MEYICLKNLRRDLYRRSLLLKKFFPENYVLIHEATHWHNWLNPEFSEKWFNKFKNQGIQDVFNKDSMWNREKSREEEIFFKVICSKNKPENLDEKEEIFWSENEKIRDNIKGEAYATIEFKHIKLESYNIEDACNRFLSEELALEINSLPETLFKPIKHIKLCSKIFEPFFTYTAKGNEHFYNIVCEDIAFTNEIATITELVPEQMQSAIKIIENSALMKKKLELLALNGYLKEKSSSRLLDDKWRKTWMNTTKDCINLELSPFEIGFSD
ncbi:MAG: hypothetical protein ACOYT4_02545 [Nanoarchaeota archaeon]